jgi:hypothetical protein
MMNIAVEPVDEAFGVAQANPLAGGSGNQFD